jgi:hypothetical protein
LPLTLDSVERIEILHGSGSTPLWLRCDRRSSKPAYAQTRVVGSEASRGVRQLRRKSGERLVRYRRAAMVATDHGLARFLQRLPTKPRLPEPNCYVHFTPEEHRRMDNRDPGLFG